MNRAKLPRTEMCDKQQGLHTSLSAAARASKRPRCPDPYQTGYVATRYQTGYVATRYQTSLKGTLDNIDSAKIARFRNTPFPSQKPAG